MSASAGDQGWFMVSVVLREIAAPSNTITVYLSKRPVLGSASAGKYVPILRQISALGMVAGNGLPLASTGTITLDNSPSSFGYERRFIDLLERYTLTEQPVKVYDALTSYQDNDVDSDFVERWSGKAKSVSVNFETGLLDIAVEGYTISDRVITKALDKDEITALPIRNVGKHLSIIIGAARQARVYQISDDASIAPSYAYGTTLGIKHIIGNTSAYKIKDYDGKYRDFKSSAIATLRCNRPETMTQVSGGENSVEKAQQIPFVVGTDNYLLKGGFVTMRTPTTAVATAGPATGAWTFRLYENDPSTLGWTSNAPTNSPIATATIDKAAYSSAIKAAANSNYNVGFCWDKPVLLSKSNKYWLSVVGTDEDPTTKYPTYLGYGSASGGRPEGPFRKRDAAGSSGGWLPYSFGGTWSFGFYAILVTETKAPAVGEINADGLGHAYFTLTQEVAPTGAINPVLTGLDVIIETDGLLDDSTGTITGIGNSLISKPEHVTRVLSRYWNLSTWVDSPDLDVTTYALIALDAYSTYPRAVAGATDGKASVNSIIAEVLDEHECSLVRLTTGKLAVYPRGGVGTVVAEFTSDFGVTKSLDIQGPSYVINQIRAYYDKNISDNDFTNSVANQDFKGYAKTLNWNSTTNGLTGLLAGASEALFGRRELQTRSYNWVGTAATMQSIGKLLLIRNALPPQYVVRESPYFDTKDIELMSVVEILDPALPAFLGTSPKAALPTYQGTEVDYSVGTEWIRATRYRAIVEGKQIAPNLAGDPVMQFTCRLLTNPAERT